ncbi:50S ribosomal protein L9 [Desulfofustis limnaeus]|jgi:large subunit ribosomal protein L9|uniref:Large ribosomal subunit protein bL9 n=1 Tax=Desulfofustis limnaeus TaxID=2740163 RepID=A0ABM7W834_9BACT|nr:50S ribosomal protein L9 [Desulfofustis limnaeus]MDX9894485.1 50S ribosomal protein L9 [Desulfofustis sp.]BDD87117.1 50S ribosomal protein L9 [Desulfofustis limnaeus]
MELILKETIDTLGREGDIVKVKPGYGRNYLLPQGKAVLATPANLAVLEKNKAEIQARLTEQQKAAQTLFQKLNGIVLEFQELVAEDDKLFGSVSINDICDQLAAKSVTVEKKHVLLSEPIKTLGDKQVSVKVGFDLFADITVRVSAQQPEA